MYSTAFTLKTCIVDVEHANPVTYMETVLAILSRYRWMHSDNDSNAFVPDCSRLFDTVGSEIEHQIGVAERSSGDFDEQFIVAWAGYRDAMDEDLTICLKYITTVL